MLRIFNQLKCLKIAQRKIYTEIFMGRLFQKSKKITKTRFSLKNRVDPGLCGKAESTHDCIQNMFCVTKEVSVDVS